MSNEFTIFVGAYTQKLSFVDGKGQGISTFKFDPVTRNLAGGSTVSAGVNPTFLALSSDQNYLYAVNEVTQGSGPNGWVSAFAIEPSSGKLSFLNRQSTQGFSPCHLCLAGDDRFAIAANYESGDICLLPRNPQGYLEPACETIQFSGSGPHPRQEKPHAHMVIPSPDGRFILAADLGGDQIWTFKLDKKQGKLLPTDPASVKLPPGSGPRHLDFHPNGRFVYVLGELDSTVTLLHYEAENGTLTPVETVPTLPADFQGQNTGAEILVAPSGNFIYVSNRGHDTLAILAIDNTNGALSLIGHQSTMGKAPRHFTIDPTGTTLIAANQDSDTLAVFEVHPDSGLLTLKEPLVHSPTPVCVQFYSQPV